MDLRLALNPDYYVLSTSTQCLIERNGADYLILNCTQKLAMSLGWKDGHYLGEYVNEEVLHQITQQMMEGKLGAMHAYFKGQEFDSLEILPISPVTALITIYPVKKLICGQDQKSVYHTLAVQNVREELILVSVKGVILETNLAGKLLLGGGNIFDKIMPDQVVRLKDAFRVACKKGEQKSCKLDVLTSKKPVPYQFSVHDVDAGTFLLIGNPLQPKRQGVVKLGAGMPAHELILESITDAFVTLDLKFNVTFCNEKARRLLGENILGRPVFAFFNAEARNTAKMQVERSILSGQGSQFEANLAGEQSWQQIRVYPAESTVSLFISDVTVLRQQEARMSRLAMYDTLTGLLNRESSRLELGLALAQSRQRPAGLVAVVMLDLDGFKLVNDTQGHPVGDLLLKEVASRLTTAVRGQDIVARQGGDEFLIILKNIPDLATAQRLATKLVKCVGDEPFAIRGQEQRVGASAGIAIFPQHADTEEELIRFADIGLYEAKRAGKGIAVVFDLGMSDAISRKARLDFDMRSAVKSSQIELVYQLKTLSIQTEIMGVKALARWHHPTYGDIQPSEFIAIAEQSGVIQEMGEYLLQKACADIVELNKALDFPLSLSFNISAKELLADDFVDVVKFAMEQSALPPQLLELEVAEKALMLDSKKALSQMLKLKELGVSLLIDDFGTGHCSLMYLTKYPLDGLKLDKQFVAGLPDSKENLEITKAVIALGQALNLTICAEGVENEEQLKCLIELGVDQTQGYFVGAPVTLSSLMAQMSSRPMGPP